MKLAWASKEMRPQERTQGQEEPGALRDSWVDEIWRSYNMEPSL
jgi:hypothetical protein